MLPPEIRRELERVAEELAAARARLARIRERLTTLRGAFASDNTRDDLRRPEDDTPEARAAQGLGA